MANQEEIYEKAKKVKEAHQDELLKKANVVGVGIGYARRSQQATSEIALVVMVSQKLPRELLAPEDILPTDIEGIPVDVQQTGELHAQG